jgi:hypothetical protein
MNEPRTNDEQRSIDAKIARLRTRLAKVETIAEVVNVMKAIIDLLDDEL